MKVIYMGTPEFAVPALKAIAEAGHEIVSVVTQPDKPKNRGKKMQPTPVKEAAEELGLEVAQPEKVKGNQEFEDYIKGLGADIAVVAAYGQILPEAILNAPKYGCVNIHASLLPKLRGAAPIQRAILEGYLYSGVTIMKMDIGLDTGDMIDKQIMPISGMTADALHDEMMYEGASMIVHLLKEVESKGEEALKGEKQDDSQATYAHMIKKSDGLLDFSKSADDIFLQINAMASWPGAYTYYNGVQIKVSDPEWYGLPYDDNTDYGKIIKVTKEGMIVQCRDSLILIKKIQFPGKKAMTIAEFIKGNTLEVGVILGQEQ